MVITGESAGGQLTISTTMALRDKPAAVPVIVHAPIVPIVDLVKKDYPSRSTPAKFGWNSEALAWCSGEYGVDPKDWRCSPLSGKLHDMPAALVLTAEFDILRDEGRAYAAALAEAGTAKVAYHEAVGSLHGFYLFRTAVPAAWADVKAFFAVLKAMIDAETARLLPV